MFGSNFRVDSLHLTYSDIVDSVTRQVRQDAVPAVMHRTAARFYRFPD